MIRPHAPPARRAHEVYAHLHAAAPAALAYRAPGVGPGHGRARVARKRADPGDYPVVRLDASVVRERGRRVIEAPLDLEVHLLPHVRHHRPDRGHAECRRVLFAAHRRHDAPSIHGNRVGVRAAVGRDLGLACLFDRPGVPPGVGRVVGGVEVSEHDLLRRRLALGVRRPGQFHPPHRPHLFPQQPAQHLLDRRGRGVNRLVEGEVCELHEQDPGFRRVLIGRPVAAVRVRAGCNVRRPAHQVAWIGFLRRTGLRRAGHKSHCDHEDRKRLQCVWDGHSVCRS